MRVLLVSHLFPPSHVAGTEVYTAELGTRLAARGVRVEVFTTEKDVSRPDLSLSGRTWRGLRVHELVNNLYLDHFRETWDRPAVVGRFAKVLQAFAPDVVHFQHFMNLSVGCLEEARRVGAGVVLTLHDFWLECPRMGQLLHADGTLCETVDPARCGTCLPSFDWRQPALARRVGGWLAGVRRVSGLDLSRLAQRANATWGRGRGPFVPPPRAESERYERAAAERTEELRRRVVASVHRFVSPSRFLAERAIAFGLPADRVRQIATGIDRDAFAPRPRARGARVRIGFLGTLVPAKGAHLLLEAWGRIPSAERDAAELCLRGPRRYAPEYVARLESLAREVGARLAGPVEHDAVPTFLAETDLLVVPSLWYENRPLVVLEALGAGTPVLVSAPGGMAELVEEGVNGWTFPIGDAVALERRLREVLADPARLDSLARRPPPAPGWEEWVDATIALYGEVVDAAAGAGDAGDGGGIVGAPTGPRRGA